MPEWDIDLTEIAGLRKWYGRQPRVMQRGHAMLLNAFAFGVREEAIRQIGKTMTVRNPRFVSLQMKVTKAQYGVPIGQQRSITGSVAIKGRKGRGDFTGWTEQEKGTRVQRKRVAKLASRGGDIHRQMLGRARLKPRNEVLEITDKIPRGGTGNTAGFIAMLARQGYKGLIKIKGNFYMIGKGRQMLAGPTLPGRSGLFKSLELVQKTKKEQPRRIKWLRTARVIYFKKHPPQKTWGALAQRLIKPPGKK